MRLKNWLFAGTSLTLLSMAPYGTFAQEAPAELPQVCIDLGFTTLEECAAAQPAGAPPVTEAAPAPEEAAPPAEEPAPAAEEAAPAPEEAAPAPEEAAPAPEAPPAAEAAPEPAPEPGPAPAEAAPEPEPAQEPEPAMEVEAEPAPAAEQVQAAPEAEPAAEPEAQVQAEPQPEPQPEPAPEAQPESAPAAEAAPQPAPEAAPAVEQPAQADIATSLAAQVDAHNAAVAEIAAGGDAVAAQARIDAALAEINAICSGAGMPDIESCLAPLGLTLSPVPAAPAPTEQAPAPAEQPAAEVPAEQPAADAPVTVDGQPAEVVEDLPAGITQEQLAPVLDSAKDIQLMAPAAVDGQAPDAAPVAEEAPVAPPPESDEAAQSAEMRAFAAEPIASVEAEAGTAVTATENTTVNQTVVNNYITNITNINNSGTNVTNNVTNNTQNNVTNNTQNNIGQQNNVTVVEQIPVPQATTGDLITQVILQVGSQLIVNAVGQDTDRFYNPQQDEVFYENLPGGRVREVVSRPDGSQVVTVRNRNGDILRRSRITPDGREIVLAYFDDRYDNDLLVWRDPGQDLPPLRLNIPVRDYVLDASYADESQVEVFFRQPPVEQVARLYSIDEVKRSARVRDSVRRLEVGNLTFDTGAATINRDQVSSLAGVANAMLALLATNPAETFLIEGHTDAVGSDISNLRLSDLRAATVARILTDFYGVPPENLATQGYGERYLKIRTEAAERENRRVTVRRITPLITVASN